ncbi:hypothetical protein [Candidatus Cardinium hertigii]|nr:hypothetical protein [Candidatus Cardinium hertigii]
MQSKKKDPINPKLQAAIDLLLEGGADLSTIFCQEGLLKVLTKNIVERPLVAELDDHLGYSKYSRNEFDNSRKGTKNLLMYFFVLYLYFTSLKEVNEYKLKIKNSALTLVSFIKI